MATRAGILLAAAIVGFACASGASAAGGSECPNELTPLSTAIPCPKTWADEAFLIPHEAIRMLSQQLVDAVSGAGFDPAQRTWQGPMLHKWYREFYFDVIHHHHDVEERLFFPFMERHLATLGLERPQLAHTSHEHLLRVMDDFLHATASLGSGATSDDTARIRELARTLRADMNAHLEEEERLFPPVLAAHFTEEQDEAITNEIIQDLGLLGNKIMLPPIYEALKRWSGPNGAATKKLDTSVPPPIKFLLHAVWMDDMALNSVAVTDALATGVHPGSSVYAMFVRHAESVILLLLGAALLAGVWAIYAKCCKSGSNPKKTQ